MALVSNSASQDWRLLVEINLTGKTLKLAEESLAFDSGFYDGRLQRIGIIDQSAGNVLDPRLVSSRNTFEIDNADGQYTTYFDAYTWTNREVIIKAGQGLAIADYEEIFRGRVLTSGGLHLTEQTLTVTVNDVRGKDARTMPVNKYFPVGAYANMEAKAKYSPIPIVYGDWTSGIGTERVPAVQIDSTVGTGGSFKVADHAIKQLESVFKNGTSVSFSSANLTTATFTLDVAYDELTDSIEVHCKGATDDGASSGTLLTSLPDLVEDILTTYLNVTSGNIDSAAFATWEGNLATADYGRRWIGTDVSSNTLITDALIEGFADMTIQGNKYTPVYRLVPLSGLDTFRESDLMHLPNGSKDFSISQDPEENYLNTVAVDYAYDPTSTRYARYEVDNTSEIADAGLRQRRRLVLNWIYLPAGAESRGERELLNFSTITEMLTTNIGPRALTKAPTDYFRVAYSKYTDNAFQIRSIRKDFSRMSAHITAWNVVALEIGRWTNSSDPSWLLSSAAQRVTNGFWTDSNGYCDTSGTPDEDSKDSIWF